MVLSHLVVVCFFIGITIQPLLSSVSDSKVLALHTAALAELITLGGGDENILASKAAARAGRSVAQRIAGGWIVKIVW